MSTVGIDCQIMLDGVGYFVEPNSYTLRRPRLRKASVLKGGAERYVDLGPGKREWRLTLLCLNGLTDYSGQVLSGTGEALRESLCASYQKTGTPLAFTDLDGSHYSVHFDDFQEQVRDPRTQLTSPSYHVSIVLVEA
jgi:hypothetical protein